MEPGRDLDALVAEKVMGWKVYITMEDWKKGGYHTYPHTIDSPVFVLESEYRNPGRLPHFSTRIADAWKVMRWLWKQNDCWFVWPDGNGEKEGFAAVCEPDGLTVWGQTEMHAICLAALKVLGDHHD